MPTRQLIRVRIGNRAQQFLHVKTGSDKIVGQVVQYLRIDRAKLLGAFVERTHESRAK